MYSVFSVPRGMAKWFWLSSMFSLPSGKVCLLHPWRRCQFVALVSYAPGLVCACCSCSMLLDFTGSYLESAAYSHGGKSWLVLSACSFSPQGEPWLRVLSQDERVRMAYSKS